MPGRSVASGGPRGPQGLSIPRALGNDAYARSAEGRHVQAGEAGGRGRTTGPIARPTLAKSPRVQRLAIGPVDDPFEREADNVAARLHAPDATPNAASPDPPPPTGNGQEDGPGGSDYGFEPPPAWASRGSLEGGGRPLPPETRRFYEDRLGYDFSGVRVHTGPEAARKSQAIDAHAFTYRSHIWLGGVGRLRPSHVLAHELVHVVQQTQPDGLRLRRGAGYPRNDPGAGLVVRRVPFWVPRGRSGTDIHELVLGQIAGRGGIEDEVGVPNADARDWGVGLKGRADLYRATRRVGIYFENRRGLPPGDKHGDLRYTEPTSLPHRGRTSRPYLRGGVIQGIDSAPQQIEIGDLKPASGEALQGGRAQLDNYEHGFRDTQALTNEWAQANGRGDRWNSLSVSRLPAGAVTIPGTFRVGSRGQNRELVIADVELRPRRGIRVRTILDPRRDIGASERIGGDLYVEHMAGGLWAYFAVPVDADRDRVLGALGRGGAAALQEADRRGHIRFADQIAANLATLRQELQQVQRLPRRSARRVSSEGIREDSPEGSPDRMRPAEPVHRDDVRDVIRRRRRTRSLRDPFDRAAYRRWRDERNDLRQVMRRGARGGQAATGPSEENLERLRLLGLIYEAEEALDPRAREQDLPSEQRMRAEIEPERHGRPDPLRRPPQRGRRSGTTRSLPDLYAWMERWTSRPADVLGLLRYRFGRLFVAISRRVERFRERIRQRMRQSFGRRSRGLARGGWVAVAVRALGRALVEVGKLLLQQTGHLLFQAIGTGVQRKLETMFDPDESEVIQEGLDEVEALAEQMEAVRNEINRRVGELEREYTDEMEFIQDLVNLADIMGPIIEVGMIIVQCGTPPGWGCLKLIAQEAIQYAVNEIVQTCYVQRWIAGQMLAIDGFNRIPESLAQALLDLMRDAAPDAIKDVFDGPIPVEPLPSPDEVPCDEASEAALQGAEALSSFHRRNGSEKTRALGELGDARGVPEGAGLGPEQLRALQEQMDASGATPTDLRNVANGTADAATAQRLEALTSELDDLARAAIAEELQAALREGRFDRRFRQMEGSNRRLYVLGRLPGGGRPGAFGPNRRVLYTDGSTRAAGVAHVVVGECRPDGTVDLELRNLTLVDASGRPVEPSLTPSDFRTNSARCIGQPPPPPVAGRGRPPPGTPPPGERAAPPPPEPESRPREERAEGPPRPEPPSAEPPSAPPSTEPPTGEHPTGPGPEGGSGRGGEVPTVGPEGSDASWPVAYEPIRTRGFQVYPADPRLKSGTSSSIVLPDNQRAILTPTVEGGEMTLRIGGPQGRIVGHASRTAAARGFYEDDWWELTSGPLYDRLMSGLARWLRTPIGRSVADRSQYPRRLFFIYTGRPDVQGESM